MNKPRLYRASAPVEGSALHRLLTPSESPIKGPRSDEEQPWEVQAIEHFNKRLDDIERRVKSGAVEINNIHTSLDKIIESIDKITCALEEGASAKR